MGDERRAPIFADRRILIAEDELVLALDVQRILRGCGCAVIGPAPTVARAMMLLEREEPDAALLDLNLKGEPATPVAAALATRGIPFVLVTGYGASLIKEPVLRSAPRVEKPVTCRRLRAALVDALERGH